MNISAEIKKIVVLIAVIALPASMACAAITYGVKYGAHNLGTTGEGLWHAGNYGGTETEICIYCHTPHNGVGGQKWLWNRTGATTDFRFYTSSPTLNFTRAVTIGDTSKMCMTCHDGVTAMNAMANPRTGATNNEGLEVIWNPEGAGGDPDDPTNMGKNIGGRETLSIYGDIGYGNLTNDHPISFDYVESYTAETAQGTLRNINTVKAAGLAFWGANQQMLECVTCHDPHVNYGCYNWRECDESGSGTMNHSLGSYNRALTPFLRKSNHSSSLCFTCHNK